MRKQLLGQSFLVPAFFLWIASGRGRACYFHRMVPHGVLPNALQWAPYIPQEAPSLSQLLVSNRKLNPNWLRQHREFIGSEKSYRVSACRKSWPPLGLKVKFGYHLSGSLSLLFSRSQLVFKPASVIGVQWPYKFWRKAARRVASLQLDRPEQCA